MVGPINLNLSASTSPSPSPLPISAATPAVSQQAPAPSPAPTEQLPPIELEAEYDAMVRIRESDGGGGLIQLELNRPLTKVELDDLRRLNGKHGIIVSENSVQYSGNYDGRKVAKEIEKILRRRNFPRMRICHECVGRPLETFLTLL